MLKTQTFLTQIKSILYQKKPFLKKKSEQLKMAYYYFKQFTLVEALDETPRTVPDIVILFIDLCLWENYSATLLTVKVWFS